MEHRGTLFPEASGLLQLINASPPGAMRRAWGEQGEAPAVGLEAASRSLSDHTVTFARGKQREDLRLARFEFAET